MAALPLTKDKAKLILTQYCVMRLSASSFKGDANTQKGLFLPTDETDVAVIKGIIENSHGDFNPNTNIPVMRSVGVSKKWQRVLLDRLIKLELIEKDQSDRGETLYVTLNRDTLEKFSKDMQSIKWLLSPDEFSKPAWLETKEVEEATAEPDEATPASGDELLDAVVAFGENLEAQATALNAMSGALKEFSGRLDNIEKRISDSTASNGKLRDLCSTTVLEAKDAVRKSDSTAFLMQGLVQQTIKQAEAAGTASLNKMGELFGGALTQMRLSLNSALERMEERTTSLEQQFRMKEKLLEVQGQVFPVLKLMEDLDSGINLLLEVTAKAEEENGNIRRTDQRAPANVKIPIPQGVGDAGGEAPSIAEDRKEGS